MIGFIGALAAAVTTAATATAVVTRVDIMVKAVGAVVVGE